MKKFDLQQCEIVRLSQNTTIRNFDCDNLDLNEFLLEKAKIYSVELLAVTYLFEHQNKTIAFYCVSNDRITHDNVSSNSAWKRFLCRFPHQKRRSDIPAVKIGRLGVHKDYQKNGIGTALLDFIKLQFIDNNKTGCRFITVDAYNDATDFYHRNDFFFFDDNEKNTKTRLMYHDLKRFLASMNKYSEEIEMFDSEKFDQIQNPIT